jgi:hypothetical protein
MRAMEEAVVGKQTFRVKLANKLQSPQTSVSEIEGV